MTDDIVQRPKRPQDTIELSVTLWRDYPIAYDREFGKGSFAANKGQRQIWASWGRSLRKALLAGCAWDAVDSGDPTICYLVDFMDEELKTTSSSQE